MSSRWMSTRKKFASLRRTLFCSFCALIFDAKHKIFGIVESPFMNPIDQKLRVFWVSGFVEQTLRSWRFRTPGKRESCQLIFHNFDAQIPYFLFFPERIWMRKKRRSRWTKIKTSSSPSPIPCRGRKVTRFSCSRACSRCCVGGKWD